MAGNPQSHGGLGVAVGLPIGQGACFHSCAAAAAAKHYICHCLSFHAWQDFERHVTMESTKKQKAGC